MRRDGAFRRRVGRSRPSRDDPPPALAGLDGFHDFRVRRDALPDLGVPLTFVGSISAGPAFAPSHGPVAEAGDETIRELLQALEVLGISAPPREDLAEAALGF